MLVCEHDLHFFSSRDSVYFRVEVPDVSAHDELGRQEAAGHEGRAGKNLGAMRNCPNRR